jgi:type 1 glutamine amidotransferase
LEQRLSAENGFVVKRLEPPSDRPADLLHLAQLGSVSPRTFDVLLFYLNADPAPVEHAEAVERFVKDGGGVMALHGTSASFRNTEIWSRMLGAKFTGHVRGTRPLQITLIGPDHPITGGLTDFSTTDEEYCHDLRPDVQRAVLARFATRPKDSVCPLGSNDMMWTVESGRGRVFYNALGHDTTSWAHPTWQQIVVNAIRWVARRAN